MLGKEFSQAWDFGAGNLSDSDTPDDRHGQNDYISFSGLIQFSCTGIGWFSCSGSVWFMHSWSGEDLALVSRLRYKCFTDTLFFWLYSNGQLEFLSLTMVVGIGWVSFTEFGLRVKVGFVA